MAQSSHQLSRRTFLALSASVGAGTLLPVTGAAATGAGSSGTATALDAVIGFAEADHAAPSSPLGRWGEHLKIALDHNRRSVGADLGSVQDLNAIELARDLAGDDTRLPAAIGVLTNDAAPATGAFANFAVTTAAALDFQRRSLGVDTFGAATIRRVELVARDATTRLAEADYTLWTSQDNVTYQQLTGWTFAASSEGGRVVHTFGGFEVQARYLKVNTRFADSAFTFVLQDPRADVRVHGAAAPPAPGPAHRLGSRDLSVYVSDDNATWTKVGGVELVDAGAALWLYGFRARGRYVKVHCHRAEVTGWTFTLTDLQTAVRVHHLPAHTFVGAGGGAWSHRTQILIRNPHHRALRDRAAHVSFADLGTEALIAAGRLQPDLRDLRFATRDGAELHAYADATGVHIRVPEISARRTVLVYAYSGNPAAANRVIHDGGALQVEYGRRTLLEQQGITHPDGPAWGEGVKVVRLPNGTMMAAAAAGSALSIHARFSTDGGWTWSELERVLPAPDVPKARLAGPGGFIVDPRTGVLSFFFLVATAYTPTGDFMDPEQNEVQQWIAQAETYTGDGRPVFGAPRRIPLRTVGTDQPVSWGLSYANGIVTRAGSHLYPMSYMIRSDGTFASNVIRSTDGGRSWAQSTSELTLPDTFGFEKGVTEVAISELGDGRILLLARQQAPQRHYLTASWSADDGRTWTPVTDSAILSSNTAAGLFPDSRGGQVLTWSGHNAFGQTSYYRNNLTAAYTDDDGANWHGYQDLLAGSALSTPGWAHISEVRTAVNADSWAAAGTDRVFAWTRPSKPAQLMLIEDFDAFVRDTHGALDVIAHRDTAGAANGTELAAHRWWRTTRTGTLDLAAGARAHRQAIRLRAAPQGEAAASRLFPAVRQARISFGLRSSQLAGGLHLCLQEGFAAHHNARGTVLSLLLGPDGELQATTDDVFGTFPDIGHANLDTHPAAGNLTALGLHQLVAMDFQNRSVGADLFEVREITGVQLVDNDLIGTGAGNRVRPEDLSVWTSDTNRGDWQRVEGWTGRKDGAVITLSGPAVHARYVKVAHPYADNAFTLANDEQRIMRVLPDGNDEQVFRPLEVPTRLAPGEWHGVVIDLDLPAGTVTVEVDGSRRARLPRLHAAEVVTHLLLSTGAAAAGEIRLDELIVQDTALGLPEPAGVGATTPIPR